MSHFYFGTPFSLLVKYFVNKFTINWQKLERNIGSFRDVQIYVFIKKVILDLKEKKIFVFLPLVAETENVFVYIFFLIIIIKKYLFVILFYKLTSEHFQD